MKSGTGRCRTVLWMLPALFLAFSPVAAQTLPTDTLFDITTSIPADATVMDFHGFRGYEFPFRGRKATVIVPQVTAVNHPWLWRSRFMVEPQTDIALLKLGFHAVQATWPAWLPTRKRNAGGGSMQALSTAAETRAPGEWWANMEEVFHQD